MGELVQFIFSLEDPTGRSIVHAIVAFFVIGTLNYSLHIVWIWLWERLNLRRVQTYFKTNQVPTDVSDLSTELHKAKISSRSIIYRRINDLVQIKQSGGEIDNDALANILTGEASRKASFSNYILGILIILGLVGTLRGLITAIIEVQPLLQDIQDLDQLPTISDALRETLAGMNTAFVTTLAGLLASLVLGLFGWLFNREQSAFLTQFERFVSTEIIPRFTQTPESSIESAVAQLTECTDTLKFATQENVSAMRQAIQQLTDTSWGGQLEQQYILANKFGTTADDLLKSLATISEHQILIKSTVESFEKLIVESMSQIREYQEALRHSLEDSVPRLESESQALKTAIEEYQRSQSRFIDDLSSTLQRQLQSITANQQDMVNVLSLLAEELQIRPLLEAQNQVFGRIETRLTENQQETVDVLTQLTDELQIHFRSAFEAQNQVFEGIKTQLTENQQETVSVLTQLTDELQIRPALVAQNRVLRDIETQLTGNRQEIIAVLTQLTDELEIRSVLVAQNQMFERIENQLIENQQQVVQALIRLADELEIRSVLVAQNQMFERIESHLSGYREVVADQSQLMQTLIANMQQVQQTVPIEATSTPSSETSHQITPQLLNQISLKFDLLNEKFDTLNNTMRRPGIYRWISEIRGWFGGSR